MATGPSKHSEEIGDFVMRYWLIAYLRVLPLRKKSELVN